MKGSTHRDAGLLVTCAGYVIGRHYGFVGTGLDGLSQLALMYLPAYMGSNISDQDLAIPPLTDPVSLIVHKALRWGGAKHRSWVTHSELPAVLFIGLWLTSRGTPLEFAVFGFMLGLVSHILADMFNPTGVPSLLLSLIMMSFTRKWRLRNFRLVPKIRFFATNGTFEVWADKVVRVVGVLFFLAIFFALWLEAFGVVKL